MLKSQIKFDKFRKALTALESIYQKPMQEDRSNIDWDRSLLMLHILYFKFDIIHFYFSNRLKMFYAKAD